MVFFLYVFLTFELYVETICNVKYTKIYKRRTANKRWKYLGSLYISLCVIIVLIKKATFNTIAEPKVFHKGREIMMIC